MHVHWTKALQEGAQGDANEDGGRNSGNACVRNHAIALGARGAHTFGEDCRRIWALLFSSRSGTAHDISWNCCTVRDGITVLDLAVLAVLQTCLQALVLQIGRPQWILGGWELLVLTHVDAGGHLQPQRGKGKPTQEGKKEGEDTSPERSHMWILLNSAANAEQGQLRGLVGFIHLQLEVRHAYEFPLVPTVSST